MCWLFSPVGFRLQHRHDDAGRFEPGGVGGELLDAIGMAPLPGERLPGYLAWLPDRTVALDRDSDAGVRNDSAGRLAPTSAFLAVDGPPGRSVLAGSRASRGIPAMPGDLQQTARCIGLPSLPLTRYFALDDGRRAAVLRAARASARRVAWHVVGGHGARVSGQRAALSTPPWASRSGAGLTRARGGDVRFLAAGYPPITANKAACCTSDVPCGRST